MCGILNNVCMSVLPQKISYVKLKVASSLDTYMYCLLHAVVGSDNTLVGLFNFWVFSCD